jgi:uncharacterized protein (TIGR00730 family)
MTRICVFAGSSVGVRPTYAASARELGIALAARGIGLVYGGGSVGLMGEIADAALAGGAEVIGVIPRPLATRELAHTGLTTMHVVESMHERKALMASLVDGFIALPGGLGTLEETLEVLTWSQLGIHRKPVGVLNVDGYYDGLIAFLGEAVREGFVRREYLDLFLFGWHPRELLDELADWRPPRLPGPWLDESQL